VRCDNSQYLGLPDNRSQNASAVDALQEAGEMPPGPQRTDALIKLASFVMPPTVRD
jgi:hypothetical protein